MCNICYNAYSTQALLLPEVCEGEKTWLHWRKMTVKRILGLLLAIIMLAGCGNSFAEGQKAPDYILEGFDGENSTRSWETNLFFSRMEERTGISFQFREYTTYSRYLSRKESIANREDLPDVLFKAELNAGEVRDLYEAGVLIDLKPYLQQYAPDIWKLLQERPDILAAISMRDGAIPALPAVNELQNNDVMWINSAWLRRLRLDMPTDAESLKEVLKAFRDSDPNANGKKDEIPLAFIGMWELRFLGHAFGITDNDYYVSVKDGKVTSSLISQQNRDFLAWLNELWKEKLIDHNGFSTADSMRTITDEKASIPYGLILSSSPVTVLPASALSSYILMDPLVYEGKQEYRDLSGDLIRGTFAITSRCKEPEKLVSWVNFLYTEEGALMAQYGLEGKEYAFREDGMWEWTEDKTTIAQSVIPVSTIGTGAAMPGICPVDFQLKYSDAEARDDISQLIQFRQYTVLPYPYVTLDREDEETVARIQKNLSQYVETTMARFVTGDIPLNDEQWNQFCKTVEEKGLNDMISVWQKYIQ